MASSILLPHCSVCKRSLKYGGFDPLLLPCLHTVCSDCLDHRGTTVSCCHCKETFNKHDYIFLKDSVTTADIVKATAKDNPTEIKCTNKTHSIPAEIWCRDCQVFYCKKCQVSHSQVKTSHSHDMIQVKNLATGESLAPKSQCPEHESYPLDLYDLTCEILICSKCSRAEHKQCESEEFEGSSLAEGKERLVENQQKMDARLQEVVKSLEAVSHQKSEIEARRAKMEKWLGYRFSELRKLVNQREEQLSKALASMNQFNTQEIERVNKSLDTLAERLQAATEYSKKLTTHGDGAGFLMLKPSVTSRAESCLAEEIVDLDVPEVTVSFKKETLDELTGMLANFGSVDTEDEESSENQRISYENVEIVLPSESDKPELYVNVTEDENVTAIKRRGTYVPMHSAVPETLESGGNSNEESISANETSDDKLSTDEVSEPLYNDCTIANRPSCPDLKFDHERVNFNKAHINNEGSLVNSKLPREAIFSQYVGTLATKPLPENDLNYWEVNTDLQINEVMKKHGILMEIGVIEGDITDEQYCASGKSNSRCLTISYCSNHNSVCAKPWDRGQKRSCNVGIAANKAGASFTLKYGILHDRTKRALTFLDLNDFEVIETLADGADPKEIWPIFGVYNPSLASVKMKVISGSEIELTEKKASLIEERNTNKD